MRDLINIVEAETPSCPYNKWQMALLKAMVTKRVPMFRVVGMWWDHAPVLPGFARIPAPEIDPASKAKCLALYRYADEKYKSGQAATAAHYAACFAAMFGWQAAFPKDLKTYAIPPLNGLFQFDPKANDLSDYLARASRNDAHEYAAAFDMQAVPCVRLGDRRDDWEEFCKAFHCQEPEQREFRVYWKHPGQKDMSVGDNMFVMARDAKEARKKARAQLDGMFIGTKPKIAWVSVKGENGWEPVD